MADGKNAGGKVANGKWEKIETCRIFLKSTEEGEKEEARERELEWQRKNDRMGEEQLTDCHNPQGCI